MASSRVTNTKRGKGKTKPADSRVPYRERGKRKTKAADSRVPNARRGRNSTKEKENRDLLLLIQYPDWQNLPTDLLQSISDRISSSIPDLLSFSAACTSWRSLARSTFDADISAPPLLLSCVPDDPSTCHLRNLIPYEDPRTFSLQISREALNHSRCRGFSFGHLIFGTARPATSILIADLFSADEYLLPKLPPPRNGFPIFTHAVLTGRPSSSSSVLFLVCSPKIYYWRFESDNTFWMDLDLGTPSSVRSAILFKGMLHVLHDNRNIFALNNFSDRRNICWKRLSDVPSCARFGMHMRLAECDGDLLLLSFVEVEGKGTMNRYIIMAFRMDLEGGAWVRVKSIGDWCLFMDFLGRCALACPQPGKWGGQTNCIYFAGPQLDRWTVLPLDGSEFDNELDLFEGHFAQWPSPAWVIDTLWFYLLATIYISTCYEAPTRTRDADMTRTRRHDGFPKNIYSMT